MAVVRRKDHNGRVLPDGVSERADGRYIYRYRVYGKPCYIYDKNLNSLKNKIAQCKADVMNGVQTNIGNISLDEWYPQYISQYKEGKVKDGTLNNYKRYYEWYVQGSVIGRMPIKELRRTQIIAHFKNLAEKKKLAHGTLRSLASMLYNCLQQALYDGDIKLNPAIDIMKDVEATPKEIREALTVEEANLLLEFLRIEKTWQNVYLPCIETGLRTGLRFGELFGLTWKDIDFKNKVIYINKSINYRDRGNGHEFFISSPKTKNSYRNIVMEKRVIQLFEMQKAYQKGMGIRDDVCIDGYKGFVFTAKTGIPYTHEAIVRALKLIVKRANEWEKARAKEEGRKAVVIPVHTPHVWRHTFCTRLVENGVSCEMIKLLMGHSSVKTSMDIYTHISQQSMKKNMPNMTEILELID